MNLHWLMGLFLLLKFLLIPFEVHLRTERLWVVPPAV